MVLLESRKQQKVGSGLWKVDGTAAEGRKRGAASRHPALPPRAGRARTQPRLQPLAHLEAAQRRRKPARAGVAHEADACSPARAAPLRLSLR